MSSLSTTLYQVSRSFEREFPSICVNCVCIFLFIAKKGRGSSSILISTMGQARMQTKRRKVVDEVDQKHANMNMNVPMAGDDPNQMQMNDQNPDHSQS